MVQQPAPDDLVAESAGPADHEQQGEHDFVDSAGCIHQTADRLDDLELFDERVEAQTPTQVESRMFDENPDLPGVIVEEDGLDKKEQKKKKSG